MKASGETAFQRRGVVEGFFGPPWGYSERRALFAFGSRRGMNTYLYAPKDDPYHRERWHQLYPAPLWAELCKLIRAAQNHQIDFVYGFHPGKGLCFSAAEPVHRLLDKAERFYKTGVRVFAILFDDIPSRLEFARDRERYGGSLARAEALWVRRVMESAPSNWSDVEWWFCPSYYSEDPLLAKTFGAFEKDFLPTLSRYLPDRVACLWTGPQVVSKAISVAHARKILKQLNRRLILWDNYPVNDLSMSAELHLGPLTGRDPRLPEVVYGYMNNPMLQPTLSLVPLATCLAYAKDPGRYRPEDSWERAVKACFGAAGLPHWKAIRTFCERLNRVKEKHRVIPASLEEHKALLAARGYLQRRRKQKWFRELNPWCRWIDESLRLAPSRRLT